jgi:hypothetical protein
MLFFSAAVEPVSEKEVTVRAEAVTAAEEIGLA